jgi:arginine N-succinyltransferase
MRPIKISDLDGLMNLLQESGYGLTSLPRDPQVLLGRIEKSEQSFERKHALPGGELYLFVMEDIFRGEIVGVSGIVSKIGGFDPCYFYELKEKEYHCASLGKSHKGRSLHLHKTHSGPAEICSLFLASRHRSHQNGRLLSLSRFLFMAEHLERFEKEVIAEMRGMVDDHGHSPFFEAVGKKFLHMPFPEADFLTMKNKTFIEELFPQEPVIVELLPTDAQFVVGKVHPNTEPAKKILEHEGFRFCGLVGIFEPGPVLKSSVKNVRTIKESQVHKVVAIEPELPTENTQVYLMANCKDTQFKACVGKVHRTEKGFSVTDVVATALKLRLGDSLRIANFK